MKSQRKSKLPSPLQASPRSLAGGRLVRLDGAQQIPLALQLILQGAHLVVEVVARPPPDPACRGSGEECVRVHWGLTSTFSLLQYTNDTSFLPPCNRTSTPPDMGYLTTPFESVHQKSEGR